MAGLGQHLPDWALLDGLAGMHDHHPVRQPADDAQVVGDEQEGAAQVVPGPAQLGEHLHLSDGVDRRCGFVGDHQPGAAGGGDRDHRPLALATRELVGVATQQLGVEADALEQSGALEQRNSSPLPPSSPPAGGLPEMVVDSVDRIEGAGRVLEDQADLPAPQLAQAWRRSAHQLLVVEADAAGRHPARRRDQPGDGQRGHRLAAAAGAHHPDDLPRPDLDVDGGAGGRAAGELHRQALHDEQAHRRSATTSRRASPTRVNARTAMAMAAPGTSISRGCASR